MNERIKQLILKAGFHPFVRGEQILFDISTEENLKEFAELIVRECARIVPDTDLGDVEGGDSAVLRAASKQIREHFGVES